MAKREQKSEGVAMMPRSFPCFFMNRRDDPKDPPYDFLMFTCKQEGYHFRVFEDDWKVEHHDERTDIANWFGQCRWYPAETTWLHKKMSEPGYHNSNLRKMTALEPWRHQWIEITEGEFRSYLKVVFDKFYELL